MVAEKRFLVSFLNYGEEGGYEVAISEEVEEGKIDGNKTHIKAHAETYVVAINIYSFANEAFELSRLKKEKEVKNAGGGKTTYWKQ